MLRVVHDSLNPSKNCGAEHRTGQHKHSKTQKKHELSHEASFLRIEIGASRSQATESEGCRNSRNMHPPLIALGAKKYAV